MIRLHFEKLSRYDRLGEPCTTAIPFPQGELYDISGSVISDGIRFTPVQCKITARWQDGSVKWLLITFLADLPGNKAKDYYFIPDNSTSCLPEKSLTVTEASGRLQINTGPLQLQLSKPGEYGLFDKILGGSMEYGSTELLGPVLTDEKGEEFLPRIGPEGWEILEQGPIVSVIQAKGKHCGRKEKSWINYTVRIHAYSGKPWIRLDYTITNMEEQKSQTLQGIELKIQPKSNTVSAAATAIATSNYKSRITQGCGEDKLYHLIDAGQLIYEANEHIPETFYGTFWADWCLEEKGGICATVYQAQQNFPKAMKADKYGVTVGILPKEANNLTLLQGMGKTHRIFLHFHEPSDTLQEINVRSLQLQLPDRPTLDPEVYERADVFENIFVKKKLGEVESALVAKADGRGKAYGILHWGDAPDPGYTQQGRGNGEPVWTNNEYDFPHAAMLMYARTSERRMLDYLLVAAEHWKDVDVCHYSPDPLRHHAQIIHSAGHTTGEVEISHEWVEGLFDYYHMTGDTSAYETALAIGENILYHLSQPRYQKKGEINARETGWALRSLVALYKETYDEKWLACADMIIAHFEAWKEEYGGWLAPYTDHTTIRVPFMISVAVGSLMRYYRIRPQEKIRIMIIDAVQDMVDNCMLENGLFYYKELPSLRRLGNNTLTLEALSAAYELTCDEEFLKYGLVTFQEAIREEQKHINFTKQIKDDAIIIQGPGPKGFAQSFYPIVSYYVAASAAGIL